MWSDFLVDKIWVFVFEHRCDAIRPLCFVEPHYTLSAGGEKRATFILVWKILVSVALQKKTKQKWNPTIHGPSQAPTPCLSLFVSLSLFALLSCFLRKRCCRLNFFHWLLSARTSKSVCLTRSQDARLQSEREGPVLFGRRVPNHLSSLLLTSTTTVPLHRVPTLLGILFFQWHRAQEVGWNVFFSV